MDEDVKSRHARYDASIEDARHAGRMAGEARRSGLKEEVQRWKYRLAEICAALPGGVARMATGAFRDAYVKALGPGSEVRKRPWERHRAPKAP